MLYLSFCVSFKIPLQLVLLGKLSAQIQLNVVLLVKYLLTLSWAKTMQALKCPAQESENYLW